MENVNEDLSRILVKLAIDTNNLIGKALILGEHAEEAAELIERCQSIYNLLVVSEDPC